MAIRQSTAAHLIPLSPGDWRVDAARSELGFLTRIVSGLIAVRGRYSVFDGGLQIDGAGQASGALRVAAGTISTGIKRRDALLRSTDFFAVESHPHMKFELTGLAPNAGGGVRFAGTLQIRDRAIPITTRASLGLAGADELRIEADFAVDHRAAGFEVRRLPRSVRIQAALTLERAG